MPTFNNRDNKRIELPNGEVFFHARSTAVVACVVCIIDGTPFVLMVERGKKVDNSGLWCMPCGYLDWDESLAEAVVRELYEETSLDIGSIPDSGFAHFDLSNAYYVESSPKAHRQNISHHFGIVLHGPLPILPPSDGLKNGEIDKVEWVKLSAIPKKGSNSELEGMFAFEHNDKVHRFMDRLAKKKIFEVREGSLS